jgi:hypothetical protein
MASLAKLLTDWMSCTRLYATRFEFHPVLPAFQSAFITLTRPLVVQAGQ